jgi:hypothetical protein
MVLRALIAVMTLVGALPFRVCTCGAAHVHHTAPPLACDLPDHDLPCGCATDHGVPEHDHDCPAVGPRCAMSVAVPATPTGAESDSAQVAPVPHFTDTAARAVEPGAKPRSPDPPPGRPLFLTLLTLRN